MHINVDVDNVVADFVGGICELVENYDRSKCTHYDWFDTAYGPANKKLVRHTLRESTDFWVNLPLVKNAREGIQFLRENGHQITWLTAPYKGKYGWADDRRLWLEKHFDILNNEEHIVYTHRKGPIMADAFIDDLPANIVHWENNFPHKTALLFSAEHNRQYNREKVDWEKITQMRFFQRDKAA